ncbi:protein NUCLEAR FUSION DEFECTIVE 6, mitochondrial-like isoform X1 [Andrographis paniculata]|uniref:protein NUCLEAR FUSION DEFECTIVE 6, mitochondrial-like isoform X1 n=1 Tax=Andrographis paniculata TaxID=175694 RepID=UPI0021E8ADF0|nr:protein NUCLEAR FUSION DEFECTIVE 6, mitochondrial-like isoform X1 [Andrographis paniculata]
MTMAAAARSVFRSSTVRAATVAPRLASQSKAAGSSVHLQSRTPLSRQFFGIPVEMSACVKSMQPYHTATASALMTSMLTVSRCGFGWLSEACNDDL